MTPDSAQIDQNFMTRALELARQAAELGEVPVGAVLVYNGQILAEAYNLRETEAMATRHAELMVIEMACRTLSRWRLTGCTLYVTLEPCPMCAGAVINSRLDRVVYGAPDPKGGAESLFNLMNDPRLNHRPLVQGGLMHNECGNLLTEFFRSRRG